QREEREDRPYVLGHGDRGRLREASEGAEEFAKGCAEGIKAGKRCEVKTARSRDVPTEDSQPLPLAGWSLTSDYGLERDFGLAALAGRSMAYEANWPRAQEVISNRATSLWRTCERARFAAL